METSQAGIPGVSAHQWLEGQCQDIVVFETRDLVHPLSISLVHVCVQWLQSR
jgi:hypothetical protein